MFRKCALISLNMFGRIRLTYLYQLVQIKLAKCQRRTDDAYLDAMIYIPCSINIVIARTLLTDEAGRDHSGHNQLIACGTGYT
jgi:hypothetical protein